MLKIDKYAGAEMHGLSFGSEENCLLQRLDGRIKTLCAFIVIIGIVLLSRWYAALSISILCLSFALLSGVSFKKYVSLLVHPFILAIFILAIMSFTVGSRVILNVGIPVYREGFLTGMLIFSRIISAVSVLILLISTTPITSVLDSLKWLRIPPVIVNIASLMLRYIFVLGDEGARIYNAQKSRCGHAKSLGYNNRMRNFGIIGGMLLVKSFSRADKTYRAMLSRGYREDSQMVGKKEISLKEGIVALLLISGTILLILVDHFYLGV